MTPLLGILACILAVACLVMALFNVPMKRAAYVFVGYLLVVIFGAMGWGCGTSVRITHKPDGEISYESFVPLFGKRTLNEFDLRSGPTSRPFNLKSGGATTDLSPEAREFLKAGIEAAVDGAMKLK